MQVDEAIDFDVLDVLISDAHDGMEESLLPSIHCCVEETTLLSPTEWDGSLPLDARSNEFDDLLLSTRHDVEVEVGSMNTSAASVTAGERSNVGSRTTTTTTSPTTTTTTRRPRDGKRKSRNAASVKRPRGGGKVRTSTDVTDGQSTKKGTRKKDEALSPTAKKVRRLERNRMSAQLHRERKKAHLETLEKSVASLKEENERMKVLASNLQLRVDTLERENALLRAASGDERVHARDTSSDSDMSGADGSTYSAGATTEEDEAAASSMSMPELLPARIRVASSTPESSKEQSSAAALSISGSSVAARLAVLPTALLACVLCFNLMANTDIAQTSPFVSPVSTSLTDVSPSVPLQHHRQGGRGRVLLSTAPDADALIRAPLPDEEVMQALAAFSTSHARASGARGDGADAEPPRTVDLFVNVGDDDTSRALRVFEASDGLTATGGADHTRHRFALPASAAQELQFRAQSEQTALYGRRTHAARFSGTARDATVAVSFIYYYFY
jgi:hypothetical protein